VGSETRDDLAERTLLLYQELEEIDFEHEQGDLTELEYAALREAQKKRVIALIEARQRESKALGAVAASENADAFGNAIEQEILRIRARRRGQQFQPDAEAPAEVPPARKVHWLWIGVPVALVLIAFGGIFQLYQSSARTLTEQTPIGQINAASLVGLAYISPDRILMSDGNGLHVSEDGGRTWTRSTLEDAPTAIAASPSGAGYAYAFTEAGLHVTTDAGETWQETGGTLPEGSVLAAAVDPFIPSQLYASFEGSGLFRSGDAGETWEPIATPTNEKIVALLLVDTPSLLYIAFEDGGVQVSVDGGETWRAASGAVTMALRGSVRSLTGAPDGSMLYAASHTGLYMTTAAGQTWVDLPLRKPLVAVTVDPSSSRTVLAITESGEVYRSRDGGIAWRNE
jgi:photosystem II stability/assembly factor-like uncharacterized protein